MRKSIFIFLFISFLSLLAQAQRIQIVEVDSTFDDYLYVQNDKLLTMKELSDKLRINQESFELIKKARRKNTFGEILGYAGYFLAGFAIAQAATDESVNLGLLAASGSLIGLEFLLVSSGNTYTKRAVDIYNSTQGTVSNYQFKPEIKVFTEPARFGLSIRF